MEPRGDCCWGLCNTAEPEINRTDIFPERFARPLPSPRLLLPKNPFLSPSLFLSVSHFIALSHLSFCHPLSSSHCASVMFLSITSTNLPFLSSLSLPVFFSLHLFPLHRSPSFSKSLSQFSQCLFISPACETRVPLVLLRVLYFHPEFIPPYFRLFSTTADLLYLCCLAVLSVGCSYLNLTLILHMELLSKHQRKEGIGEQSEISGGRAKATISQSLH